MGGRKLGRRSGFLGSWLTFWGHGTRVQMGNKIECVLREQMCARVPETTCRFDDLLEGLT